MSHRSYYVRFLKPTCRTYILVILIAIIFIMYALNYQLRNDAKITEIEIKKFSNDILLPLWLRQIDFEGFDNNTGTENGCYVVPNIIHFIKFNQRKFSFVEMICIFAAYKRQRPELLYIHTNVEEFYGKYWDIIKNIKGLINVLIVRSTPVPQEIFNVPIKEKWRVYHGSDLMRIKILMEFGGIYLDNDMYLVKDLNDFRRFEMVIGWKYGRTMGNQIMIAHKDARFLKEYLMSYMNGYDPNNLLYNAAIKPTKEILHRKPYLVHRVEEYFGIYNKIQNIFMNSWENWKDYYSLHLLTGHQYFLRSVFDKTSYPVIFEDFNIVNYKNITFYQMVTDLFDPGRKRF